MKKLGNGGLKKSHFFDPQPVVLFVRATGIVCCVSFFEVNL